MLLREPSELGVLKSEPRETLQEALHRTLLEMILFGFFDKGTRLYPQQLAEHFDVSLTPVREALMRLATEGYIEAIPRRGFHVRVPTAKQIVDLWQARLGLELIAGEVLIDKLARGEIENTALAPARDIQQELDADPEGMTHRRHIELNGSFHRKLVELSDNSQILTIYDGIHQQLLGAWVQRGLESWRDRFEVESQDHNALLEALESHDHATYTQTMRKHIGRSLDGALDDLEQQRSSDPSRLAG